MNFSVLGSGSQGNSVYIESGTTSILIDAGFSGKEIESRLKSIGRSIENLDAIFVTHEHLDHIQGVGVLSRRCKIPVYSTYGTIQGGEPRWGELHKCVELATGSLVEMQDFQIRPFSISHDTGDPVGFVVDNGTVTLAYCTDTGKASHLLTKRLAKCNGLVLEFNHDLQMLKDGPYPLAVQQRVRSDHGHLSNEDGAGVLQTLLHDKLYHVILAHLSATNNHPELALKAAKSAIGDDKSVQIKVAAQGLATELLVLREP